MHTPQDTRWRSTGLAFRASRMRCGPARTPSARNRSGRRRSRRYRMAPCGVPTIDHNRYVDAVDDTVSSPRRFRRPGAHSKNLESARAVVKAGVKIGMDPTPSTRCSVRTPRARLVGQGRHDARAGAGNRHNHGGGSPACRNDSDVSHPATRRTSWRWRRSASDDRCVVHRVRVVMKDGRVVVDRRSWFVVRGSRFACRDYFGTPLSRFDTAARPFALFEMPAC